MGVWEDGFAAGYERALQHMRSSPGGDKVRFSGIAPRAKPRKRASSAYSRRYGAAFKRLAPKYKKKSGGWKKDGFKRCSAAARRAAKR